jgi:hypothetical protein
MPSSRAPPAWTTPPAPPRSARGPPRGPERTQVQLERLRAEAPDLADLEREERLTLAGALADVQARRERDRQHRGATTRLVLQAVVALDLGTWPQEALGLGAGAGGVRAGARRWPSGGGRRGGRGRRWDGARALRGRRRGQTPMDHRDARGRARTRPPPRWAVWFAVLLLVVVLVASGLYVGPGGLVG